MPLAWSEMLAELQRADLLVTAPAQGPSPSVLSADSRAVAPGGAYVAVRGSQADGHRFVPDAVRRGAALAIVEMPSGADVPEIVVRDGRRAALVLGAAWY